MYIRIKKFGKEKQRRYFYIVKTINVNGKPKQKVIKYLGTIQNILNMAREKERSDKK